MGTWPERRSGGFPADSRSEFLPVVEMMKVAARGHGSTLLSMVCLVRFFAFWWCVLVVDEVDR